jgi:hypothetical protein
MSSTIARANAARFAIGDFQPDEEAEVRQWADREGVAREVARALPREERQTQATVNAMSGRDALINPMADEYRASIIADDIQALRRVDENFDDVRPSRIMFGGLAPEAVPLEQASGQFFGGFAMGWRRQAISQEMAQIGAPLLSPEGSRELNTQEFDAIRRRVAERPRWQTEFSDRPIEWVTGQTGEAAASVFFAFSATPLPTILGAAAGGVVGAGAGAVAAAPAAVGGLPGYAAAASQTVPAGAVAGARTGGGIGFQGSIYAQNFSVEFTEAYVQYKDTRLNTGERMDHDTALGAATLTGVVNGALDAAADRFLIDQVPGLNRLFSRRVSDTVDELLQTPQGQNILRQIGQRAAQAATIEGATEFLQTLVQLGIGEGAVATAEGALPLEAVSAGIGEAVSGESLALGFQSAIAGAVGGGTLVLGAAPIIGPAEAYFQRREQRSQEQRAATAEGRIEIVENAIAAASETRLVDRDRGELAQFINEATTESPVSTIYVAPADLQSLAQERGVTYEALAQSIGASAEQIAQVDATPGTLIEIPIGDFIAAVAKTDLQQAAVEIIKTDPMLFTRREIGALREAGQEEAITVAERLAKDMAADIEGRTEVAALERDLEAELAPVQQAIEEGLAPLITDGAARQIGDKGVIPYARITAQSYAVIGQIEGITASKARQLYPLRFAAMERGGQGLGQPIEEGAPVEGGPAVRAGRREIPVLPEPNTPEWNALLQAVADKQARGERLTANERAIANLNREDAAELSRILQRIREGKELTPASQRFLRERGYDPVTGQPVEEGFGQSQRRSRLTPDEAKLVQERADELANAAIAASACAAKQKQPIVISRGLGSMADIRPISPGEQDLIAYGAGGIAALTALAIPATITFVHVNTGMNREMAEQRQIREQMVQGTPPLRERLQTVASETAQLREEIAAFSQPPEGMVQSDVPRVAYPQPNERRQARDGFVDDFTDPGDPASDRD